MLLTGNTASGRPPVWSASATLPGAAGDVLDALTDPEAIAQWAPVRFEVEGLAGGRLRAGSRERVRGSIAGIRTTFEVLVTRADAERLELVADGPVSLDVCYSFSPNRLGVMVDTTVGIRRRRGLTAQLLQSALAALLNAGALSSALRRLEASLVTRAGGGLCAVRERELLAA